MNKVWVHFLLLVFSFSGAVFAQDNSVFNQFDESGKRHGKWKGYYESKRLRYEGEFRNGKEIGTFKYYDDLKSQPIIATREFKENEDACFTVFYSGKYKVSEGMVVNKKYHGEWRYFHKESTVLMTLENYVDGKLEGVRKVYYKDGTLAEESYYKKGLKDGPCKLFNNAEKLIEDSNYLNGELHGSASFFDQNGLIASKGNYKNGKSVGIWTYYQNGKKIKEVSKSPSKKERTKKKETTNTKAKK
jgi:antitoxin component YwqK of YwqJK toxin-antitoxin module